MMLCRRGVKSWIDATEKNFKPGRDEVGYTAASRSLDFFCGRRFLLGCDFMHHHASTRSPASVPHPQSFLSAEPLCIAM